MFGSPRNGKVDLDELKYELESRGIEYEEQDALFGVVSGPVVAEENGTTAIFKTKGGRLSLDSDDGDAGELESMWLERYPASPF